MTQAFGEFSDPIDINQSLAPEYLKAAAAVSAARQLPDPIPKLCTLVTANAFDSDWTQLARPTVASFRRRKAGKRVKGNLLDRQSTVSDRLKKELRFTPLRLEDPTQLTRKSQSTSRVRSSQARQGKEP